ncbi:MAG TPA: FkbM family methyltransferase [Bryobacteraceae bacterium]
MTSWHDYPGALLGTTEKPLLDWFSRNVGDSQTWLDVGAHYGYTAIALSRLVGGTGRVFAFEPVLSTAGCISRTRELNRLKHLTVVPFALDQTDAPQTAELPLVRGMADSTIARNAWTERIMTTSLDALWPSLCGGDRRVDGIKIDVQGMEFSALLGMRDILARQRPKLVIEFHSGVDRRPILDLLRSCGYAQHYQPIEPSSSNAPGDGSLLDDHSYAFLPLSSECEFSSTASSTART